MAIIAATQAASLYQRDRERSAGRESLGGFEIVFVVINLSSPETRRGQELSISFLDQALNLKARLCTFDYMQY